MDEGKRDMESQSALSHTYKDGAENLVHAWMLREGDPRQGWGRQNSAGHVLKTQGWLLERSWNAGATGPARRREGYGRA